MPQIEIGYSDGDVETNRSPNESIQGLIAKRYSRREAMFGGLATFSSLTFGSSMLAGCGSGGNAAPVVNAGQSATTTSGTLVTLTGDASDKDSTVASVGWSQVSGPTVTLSAAATKTATFTAPAVSKGTDLEFEFSARDDAGKLATARTTITINPAQLGFTAVAKSLADVVSVPAGYSITVLYRTGDPIDAATAAYVNNGTDADYSHRAGDHHDGLSYFGLAASGLAPDRTNNSRGLLVLNHENINQAYLHPSGATTVSGARPTAEVIKEIECHGVSVVEISRTAGTWGYVRTSGLNRRITPTTPMDFSGPVKASALLYTAFSPAGVAGRGTLNNCANGYTPWNTYLTNEENWAGYFRRNAGDNVNRTAALGAKSVTAFTRYGLNTSTGDTLRAGNFGWATAAAPAPGDTSIARFNASVDVAAAVDGSGDFRNEPNQFGWVVEIDPFDPASTPRKRTALGRMNHEGCWPSLMLEGRRPAFYMGDDAVNEYVYKFVSATPWVAADANSSSRLAMGDRYLDSGTLYVAKFNADGTGQWLPLVFGQGPLTAGNTAYPFSDQADVLTHARLAGDALGATKMDRPEWTAVNPATGEMYLTLTQNTTRTATTTDAANPRAYSDPKTSGSPTVGNANGHILRLRETNDSAEATTFVWDIYLFGSGRDLDPVNINLSGLNDTNDFSMCDGLWFSRPSNVAGQVKPVLWIETDDGAYTDVTNCMLLAAIPGTVADGASLVINNTVGGSQQQSTRVGAAPGTTLRRFLVGPVQCEITGIDSTPDGRSVFVNVQHPGEQGNPANITSHWPASQTSATAVDRPRSATIVITKNDGGIVGL